MAYQEGPAARHVGIGSYIKIGLLAFVAILAVLTFTGSFYTVEERERAIVTRNGAFLYVADPGLHLKLPFLDSVVQTIPVDTIRTLTIEKAETFTTGAQPQHVDLWLTVQWTLPSDNAERAYRLGGNIATQLQAMVMDRAKKEVGSRHADAIPSQRAAITDAILATVRSEAARLFGVQVIDVQLTNYDYSRAYREAVDAAAVAQQNQAKAEADAVSARRRAEGEANAAIERARGEAQSRLAIANADAQAIRARGEAEADSIRAQTEALGQNPNIVALEQARRWDGKLPTQMLGSAPVPFVNLTGR